MSDENAPAAAAAAAKPAPQLNIRAQLTRNLTFSNPGALKRFEKTPTIAVNINVDASKSADTETDFIVGIRIEASAKSEEEPVYLSLIHI